MNKESTWEECIESNSSIQVSPDKAKAKSRTTFVWDIILKIFSTKRNCLGYLMTVASREIRSSTTVERWIF